MRKNEVSFLITVPPGSVFRLPGGRPLSLQVVSGIAYITHTGRDLLLWRGDSQQLEAASVRTWGVPLLSALGDTPVTLSVRNDTNEET